MKIQNLLLTAITLILLNILFYNINMVSFKAEKPNSGFESNEKTVVQLVEKILEMNTNMMALQSKSPNNLSIDDLKQFLVENGKKASITQHELKLYIEKLETELNHKAELPFSAAIPGTQGRMNANNSFSKHPLITAANTTMAVNYSLIDEMDETYFSSSNEMKGGDIITNKSSVNNKDLEDFNRYINYVNPEVLNNQKEQIKGKDYVPAETLLAMDNYYNEDELKTYLKAKQVTKDLKGYCINLLVTDEMLSPNHPIFENFGGLMMEEVSKNEYRYFIGSFTTRNGASKHLENVLHSKFPEAEVVFYKKGNRKNNLWQFFFGPLG